jgi:hypothetical protein
MGDFAVDFTGPPIQRFLFLRIPVSFLGGQPRGDALQNHIVARAAEKIGIGGRGGFWVEHMIYF